MRLNKITLTRGTWSSTVIAFATILLLTTLLAGTSISAEAVPSVTTQPATDISRTSAALHGNVTSVGYSNSSGMYPPCFAISDDVSGQSQTLTTPCQVSEGFENQVPPSPFYCQSWTWIKDGYSHSGSCSAKSGNIGNSKTSALCLHLQCSQSTSLSFYYSVSSEQPGVLGDGDHAIFYINSYEAFNRTGEVPWTLFNYVLAPGDYYLTWRYTKDWSGAKGSDSFWVDDVKVTSGGPFSYTATGLTPGTVYKYYAAAGNSLGYAFGSTETFRTPPALPSATADSATNITPASATLTGHCSATPHGECADAWGFEWKKSSDPAWGLNSWSTEPPEIVSEGFENGNMGALVNVGPDPGWQLDNSCAHGGSWSLKSGPITSGQKSIVKLDVNLAAEGMISFARRVSSVTELFFKCDGSVLAKWKGSESGFYVVSCPIPAGPHTLTWEYAKGALSPEINATWIDDIRLQVGGPMSHDLSGLDPATGYQFRAWAENSGGRAYGDPVDFTTMVAPVIISVTPSSAKVNDEVTIDGINFGDVKGNLYVSFGGLKATVYTAWSDTEIKCNVPAGAAGVLDLAVAMEGWTSSPVPFKVIPTISSISPTAGTTGATLTINGSGFGDARGTSYVKFGSTKVATYYSWSTTKIKVKTPSGISRTCYVVVCTSGGTSNAKSFKVKPSISSISPTSGKRGSKVTITGKSFGSTRYSTSYMKFGSTKVSTYYSWKDTKIVVKVPSAPYGKLYVKVTTTGGTSAGKYYTVKR